MNVYPLKRFVILCFFSLIFKSLEYVLVIMFFFFVASRTDVTAYVAKYRRVQMARRLAVLESGGHF